MKLIGTFINLFFLAGALLLLFFIVLSGSSKHFPLDRFYWLSADTSGIRNAPNTSAWTFWGVCEKNDFSKCTLGPAYPISPVDNFGTTSGVPQKFIDSRDTFYYLTRFSFAFTIVSLCFTGVAFIIDILGLCFSIIDRVVIAFISFALFFIAGTAALQTAGVVLAKQAFEDADLSTHIGVKLMAITWTTVVLLLIVFFNTCFANIAISYRKHIARVNAAKEDDYEQQPVGGGPVGDESSFTRTAPAEKDDPAEEGGSGGIRFFKIKRNHKTSDEESV